MQILLNAFKRPGFLVAFAILLIGALGLNAATVFMKLQFRKEALPLRAELPTFPKDIGPWISVRQAYILDEDTVHNLGTDKYVFRDYVDTSAVGTNGVNVATKEEVLALENLPDRERQMELSKMRGRNPHAIISLALTYYTGKVDTVPHVPDRCYVADGFQPSDYKVENWTLGEYAPGVKRELKTRFIDFEDQTAKGRQNPCVAYFFHANGDYMDDPNAVRFKLQDLRAKYAYFSKIEVMTLLPPRAEVVRNDQLKEKDRQAAADSIKRFLTLALPEVEKLLPDTSRFKTN